MNPYLNQREDGKALDVMQTQGRRDALTEVRDWVLERIAGVRASSPQPTITRRLAQGPCEIDNARAVESKR
jgi:hypothetical protein